jgi:hypothetical protein
MSKSLVDDKKKKVKRPQKEIDDVIKQHLDKLEEKLGDDVLFWTFPDLKGFKRIHMSTLREMQAYIKEDVNKYKNRKVCEISIAFRHRAGRDSFLRKQGIWLTASVLVMGIDENGELRNKKNFNNMCAIRWEEEDFRVSKLTFKLLNEIMHLVAEDKHQCIDLYGISLHKVIADIKKKNIDLSDVLSPLAGIKKYK